MYGHPEKWAIGHDAGVDIHVIYFSDRFDAECELNEGLHNLGEQDAELKRLVATVE